MSTEAPTMWNSRYGKQPTKTCKTCGGTFPREQFPIKQKAYDTRWPYCQDCYPAARKALLEAQRARGRQMRRKRSSGMAVDRERAIYLDPSRIVEWLDTLNEGDDALADWLGTTTRQLFRWRNEQVTTPLDSVDRMFVHAGVPWKLKELYPELFWFDEDGSPHPDLVNWTRARHNEERADAA